MTNPTLYARKNWLEQSRFLSRDTKTILDLIATKVSTVKDPVVLFDLDSTLYEVAPRNLAIIRDWIAHSQKSVPQKILTSLNGLKLDDIGYSLKDTFQSVGLSLDDKEVLAAWENLKAFWWDRFFANHYLPHDLPYPGGVDYAHRLYHLGAKIIYLTGRDEPRMGEGTRANLLRDGFPHDEGGRTRLLLKSHGDKEDLKHKQDAFHVIKSIGNLVASFENEPMNFVAIQELFPEAMHVFVETVFSDYPAKPTSNAYLIRGFRH